MLALNCSTFVYCSFGPSHYMHRAECLFHSSTRNINTYVIDSLTVPECPSLPVAANSFIQYTSDPNSHLEGTFAIYICLPGFDLTGNVFRICLEDGSWGGTEPTCRCMMRIPIVHACYYYVPAVYSCYI